MFSIAKGPKATLPTNAIEDRLLICTDTGEMFYDYKTANVAQIGTNRVKISGGASSGGSTGESGTIPSEWETRLLNVEAAIANIPTITSGTAAPTSSMGEDGDIYIQHT